MFRIWIYWYFPRVLLERVWTMISSFFYLIFIFSFVGNFCIGWFLQSLDLSHVTTMSSQLDEYKRTAAWVHHGKEVKFDYFIHVKRINWNGYKILTLHFSKKVQIVQKTSIHHHYWLALLRDPDSLLSFWTLWAGFEQLSRKYCQLSEWKFKIVFQLTLPWNQ